MDIPISGKYLSRHRVHTLMGIVVWMERFSGTIRAKQKNRNSLRTVGLKVVGAHGLEPWTR